LRRNKPIHRTNQCASRSTATLHAFCFPPTGPRQHHGPKKNSLYGSPQNTSLARAQLSSSPDTPTLHDSIQSTHIGGGGARPQRICTCDKEASGDLRVRARARGGDRGVEGLHPAVALRLRGERQAARGHPAAALQLRARTGCNWQQQRRAEKRG
jgi:hypothetical protein